MKLSKHLLKKFKTLALAISPHALVREEFVLLLPNTDEQGAYEIANQIRTDIENTPITTKENKIIHFTISGGISFLSTNDNNIEKLLDRADKALYLAKKSGRNKIMMANIN